MARLTPIDPPDEIIERPPSPDPAREARLAVLERYMTDRRQQRLEHALRNRIGSVAMVVDGIYDLGNASAIMRTCEGLGIHRLYFAETAEKYKPAHRTSQGSHKWLSIQTFPDPIECIEAVRRDGYFVYGAALETEVSLEEIDVSRPVALAMGSESEGLSEEMLQACDGLYRIDMFGLSQSFNVSVAAAISLHHVLARRTAEGHMGRGRERGDLSPQALDALREEWYRRGVNNSEVILTRELGDAPPPLTTIEGPLGELE